MKKYLVGVILTLSVCSVCGSSYAADYYAETTLTVSESNIIKPSDKRLLGANDDSWGQSLFNVGHSTAINKDLANAFLDTGTPIYIDRRAGSTSQEFKWKNSIGDDIEGRGYTYNAGEKMAYGIAEWIKGTRLAQDDVKFVFTLNMVQDTAKDHADLVRYLCLRPDDENAVDEDGVNWAQKRVNGGILEPVDVEVFELGNEVDWICYKDYKSDNDVLARAKWYVDGSLAAMEAMRAVKPDIRFSAQMFTVGNDNGWAALWNQYVIEHLGDKVDYISLHYYYNGTEGGTNHYGFQTGTVEGLINTYLRNIPEDKRPKLFVSEHAVWAANEGADDKKRATTSLSGATDIGKFVTLMANRDDVAIMTYHSLLEVGSTVEKWNNGWAMMRGFTDGKIYATGAAEAIKTMGYGFGNGKLGENLVSTTLTKTSANLVGTQKPHKKIYGSNADEDIMTACTTKMPDGSLRVILVNSSASTAHRLTFNAQNQYKLAKEWVLTADTITADNGPETPNALYCKENQILSEEQFTNYLLDTDRIVVLELVPINSLQSPRDLDIKITKSENNSIASGLNEFDVDITAFENNGGEDIQNVTLMVIPEGNAETIENSKYFESRQMQHNFAHFSVTLDDIDDTYIAIAKASGNGFEYEAEAPILTTKSERSRMIAGATIKQTRNDLDVTVYSSPILPQTQSYRYEVLFNEKPIMAEYRQKECAEDSFSIKMPKDAYEGTYTLRITCPYDTATYQKEFYYAKPNEDISLSNIICDENGTEIKNTGISTTAYVSCKNNTNEIVNTKVLIAFYDDQGRLLNAQGSEQLTFAANEEQNIPIAIDNPSAVNCIKIMLWTMPDMQPNSNVYYIK